MVRLFVYGTLKKGERAEGLLGHDREFLGEQSIIGSIYDLGSFPGVILDGRGEIFGHMFLVNESQLPRIDSYEGYRSSHPEGSLYFRRTLTDDAGEFFTYEYNGAVAEDRRIANGKWTS